MPANTFLSGLLSTESPLLPAPALAHVYLVLGWAVVLAGVAAWLLPRLGLRHRGVQRAVVAAVVVWCLWPGPASPVWWLGLAFRAPSLLSVALCLWLLKERAAADGASASRRIGSAGLLVLVLLGWALVVDTLALWPIELYALGFAPVTVGLVAFVGLLPWLLRGDNPGARAQAFRWASVLAIHVALRLPTGNLWDALLDPWLWVVLQVILLRRLAARAQRARHQPVG